MHDIRLLTLDLDDTLWSIEATIARAEAELHAWLTKNCPATAAAFQPAGLRLLRREAEALHPEHRHDLSELRRASIRLALRRSGGDPALADAAFEVFRQARNRAELFDDVLPALNRLRSRYVIGALTNGNACIKLAGLGDYFDFSLSAREAGCAKPNRAIFREACRRADVGPDQALHAGDDIDCDVRGALGAGMHAAWINRDRKCFRLLAPPALTLPDLGALADRLLPRHLAAS